MWRIAYALVKLFLRLLQVETAFYTCQQFFCQHRFDNAVHRTRGKGVLSLSAALETRWIIGTD
ncbi:hypothetical protein T190_00750 [Sinorhizobium meliloti CCBAU 01290]|nr:hypothetical protein T190_00750 [Sinorhizobium meliloti CCBAU 01290]